MKDEKEAKEWRNYMNSVRRRLRKEGLELRRNGSFNFGLNNKIIRIPTYMVINRENGEVLWEKKPIGEIEKVFCTS